MELAGYNSVAPLGMAGTGDAEILPDSGANPLQMADAYAGRNRQAKMAQQQAVGQLGHITGKFWSQDVPVIRQQQQSLHDLTYNYLKNNNSHVNPMDKEWQDIERATSALQYNPMASMQHEAQYNQALKDIQANPTKLDNEYNRALLDKFKYSQIWERDKIPLILKANKKTADLEKGISEGFGKLHQNERQTVRPDLNNGGYLTTESKSYSPETLNQEADDLYYTGMDGEASYREAADADVNALPKEHHERLAKLAAQQNIPIGQAYVRESFKNRSTTTNKQSINEFNATGRFGSGSGGSTTGVERITSALEGIADPSSSAWGNQPADFIDRFQGKTTGDKVSTVLKGYAINKVPVVDADGKPAMDANGKPITTTANISSIQTDGSNRIVNFENGSRMVFPENKLSVLGDLILEANGFTAQHKNQFSKIVKEKYARDHGTEQWTTAEAQLKNMSDADLVATLKQRYPNATPEQLKEMHKKARGLQ